MSRARRGTATANVGGLPVAALRVAVERAVAAESLRAVARGIGLSPNAVRNFIRGATPRPQTRARIERWLAAQPTDPGYGIATFTRLITQATPELPPSEASLIGRELAHAIADAYQRRRLPPPRWVRELTRHYDAGRD